MEAARTMPVHLVRQQITGTQPPGSRTQIVMAPFENQLVWLDAS